MAYELRRNKEGEPLMGVPFTGEELQELLFLIDDEPVDELILVAVRRKVVRGRKNLAQALRREAER